MRVHEMTLSDIDLLTADTPVPARAWRAAGLDPDPAVTTLADCTVAQLHAFASIDAVSPAGVQFRAASGSLARALEAAVEPDVAIGLRAARWSTGAWQYPAGAEGAA